MTVTKQNILNDLAALTEMVDRLELAIVAREKAVAQAAQTAQPITSPAPANQAKPTKGQTDLFAWGPPSQAAANNAAQVNILARKLDSTIDKVQSILQQAGAK